MSSNARVEYRNLSLAESAEVSEADDGGVFVALEEPPPVRSVVRLVSADGSSRDVVLTRVVEVPDEGAPRGFHAKDAGDDDRERAAKVGTEHLEGSSSSGDEGSARSNGSDAAGNMSMAMPAPVVVDTEEDEADLDAARRAAEARASGDADDTGEAASGESATPAAEGDAAADSDGGGASESGESTSQGRRKRGRGRGRRRK